MARKSVGKSGFARSISEVAFFAVWACLLGCGDGESRREVSGSVHVNGTPIETGEIRFIPTNGTSGPTAGAVIKSGVFRVADEAGPFVGEYRVEITATKKSGKRFFNEAINKETEFEEEIQFLPACYNAQSTLNATVTSNGPNEFKFVLTTK